MDTNVQFNLLKTVTTQLGLSLLEMKNETKAYFRFKHFYLYLHKISELPWQF